MRRGSWIILLGVLLLVAAPRSASAQVSIWLKKGVSGAGIGGLVQTSDEQTAYGLNGGYSFYGTFELGLTVAFLDIADQSGVPDDLVGAAVAPRVEWHPVKQSATFPVSVGLGAGVTGYAYSSDEFEQNDEDLSAYSVSADVSVYRFFKLSSNVGITPAAGLGYAYTSATFTQGTLENTETDDAVNFALGGYIAFLDQGGRIWGITPSVTIGSESTIVGLQAGVVWTL